MTACLPPSRPYLLLVYIEVHDEPVEDEAKQNDGDGDGDGVSHEPNVVPSLTPSSQPLKSDEDSEVDLTNIIASIENDLQEVASPSSSSPSH